MTTADHRDELELSGALILIVDDTPENIQLLGDILAKEGFRLSVATGGQQALSIAAKKLPDIILLDILMPDIDGFEVCELLNKECRDGPYSHHVLVRKDGHGRQGTRLSTGWLRLHHQTIRGS